MVQVGLNTGPRHARAFGIAKSFVKNLSEQKMVEHDEEVIAGCSLMWQLALGYLPTEVTGSIVQSLKEADLPRLQTRNVHEGESSFKFLLCTI